MNASISRPILRYHGGKWMLAPWIISHFPKHTNYVELFGGAASVLLRKQRSRSEVYNEIDSDVVNLFLCLRDSEKTAKLCHQIELTPFSRDEFLAAYDRSDDAVESARRYVVRSFMGFASTGNREYITGFRAASKQSGRPHALDWANVPESLHAVTERLKGVTIESRHAFKVIAQQDSPDTLFYADPPYLMSTRNCHTERQYRFEMATDEHRRLCAILCGIKGKAILSGYPNELYDSLLPGWTRVERKHRKASQIGSTESTEVLWMNFEP
jgi:DNA adenine methylase